MDASLFYGQGQNISWQILHIVEYKQESEIISKKHLIVGQSVLINQAQAAADSFRRQHTEPPTSFSLALLLQCHCPSLKFLQLQLQPAPLPHFLLKPPLQHHDVHPATGIGMRLFPRRHFFMFVNWTVSFALHG